MHALHTTSNHQMATFRAKELWHTGSLLRSIVSLSEKQKNGLRNSKKLRKSGHASGHESGHAIVTEDTSVLKKSKTLVTLSVNRSVIGDAFHLGSFMWLSHSFSLSFLNIEEEDNAKCQHTFYLALFLSSSLFSP